MAASFVIADLHLGHLGMCQFMRADGVTKLRPWDTPEEMDEAMVERWNATVAPGDKVYVLGDVVMNKKALPTVGRLNGKKKLIMGNHDILKLNAYREFFYEVAAYRVFEDMIFSHIPIHEASLKQRWRVNVHGHLHDSRVMQSYMENDTSDPGESWGGIMPRQRIHPRYFCVSAEHIDYTPLSIEEMRARITKQQEDTQ